MKLKKTILRNTILRYNFKKKELQFKSLKILTRLKLLNYLNLLSVHSRVTKLSRYAKVNNTCFITSRSNGIYKKFNLSRLKIKELGNNAFLLGLKKYNW